MKPAKTHTTRRFLGILFVGFLCGATVATAAQASKGEPIKIGAVLSLTGAGAGIGQPERQGILLAEKVINDAGHGVCNHPIKILIEDDGSRPNTAKSKGEKLVYDESVVALIGGTLTASTDAMAPITNTEDMAQVSFTGLGPKIEKSYKSLYHMMPPQQLNARAMLDYTIHALGVKEIGVLYDSGYGQVVMSALKPLKSQYGVDFVAAEKFDVGALNVTTQAAKVKAANPKVVFVIATSPVPFRNVRQVGMTQPIVSAIGSASYDYVKGMGAFANNIVFPEFLVGEDPRPNQAKFVKIFKNEYNTLPKNFEAAGWDTVHIIADAIENAGCDDISPHKIATAMRRPYAGVMTSYDFSQDDMTGIKLSSYVYSKVVDGKFHRLDYSASE